MEVGSGIAVAGIWVAVAIVGWKNVGAGMILGICALLATLAIAGVS